MRKSFNSLLMRTLPLWSIAALALLAGCATPGPQEPSFVTGTATYRERISLPPQAVFEASIEDVSRADAPSTVIASTRIESPRVPVEFSIPYEIQRIQPNGRYVVRARIMLDGRMIFTTDTAYPVLGASGTDAVQLLLRRVGTGTGASPGTPSPQVRRMRGLYNYMADAAMFMDCASGAHLPVAQQGNNAALQSAYVATRKAPGEIALATVDGRVAPRPATQEGAGRMELVVERFVSISPDQQCPSTASTATLENTYWKLLSLRGQPVQVAQGQREPHLIFQGPQKRVAGSGGCNRLMGSYVLDGQSLSIGRVAGTMMACAQGGEQERAFLDVLPAVSGWRINGERLELQDATGATIAEFESRYL